MRKMNAKRAAVWLLSLLLLLTALPLTTVAAEHTVGCTQEWTYTKTGESTATGECVCGATAELALTAPADTVYNGQKKNAVITGLEQGMTPGNIVYYDNTWTELTSAPAAVGSYIAEVTLGSRTLSVKFDITQAVISALDLDALVTAPVAGKAPGTAITAPAGCSATLLWTPAAAEYGYNTPYTATVTVEIVDDGYRFANTVNGGQGWQVSVDGAARVFTKTFTTEKITIHSYTPPVVPSAFEYRYADFAAILSSAHGELPTYVTAVTELGEKQIPLIWSCEDYDNGDKAENVLHWALDLSDYRIIDDSLARSGSKPVTNAPEPIHLTYGGGALYLNYGQPWSKINTLVISMFEKDTDNKDPVDGTWEILGYAPTDCPDKSGSYRARFTPANTKIYEVWEGEIPLEFSEYKPDITITFDQTKYYPTQTVQVSVSAKNHFNDAWFLTSDLITVTYTIDGQDMGTLPATATDKAGVYLYSFTLPVQAEGKVVQVKVTTANVTSQYISTPGAESFTVEERIPVNNSAIKDTVEITYVPTFDIADLFVIGTGAGKVHYELREGNSFAQLEPNGSLLTIDKAGIIKLRLTTDADGIYAAGNPVEVTLIVSRASGSGSITVKDSWVYGQTVAPVPSTDTNDVSNVTYYYEGVGSTVYPKSTTPPTDVGTYTVYAVFGETERYLQCTTDAVTFKITPATPDIGDVSCVGDVYDTTEIDKVNGMLVAGKPLPGTLQLIAGTKLDCDVTEYTYEFIPDSDNYTSIQGTVTLNVIKDKAETLTVVGTLNKLDYTHGDRLELDGVTIEVVYTSGATQALALDDKDLILPTLDAGDTTATIEYREVKYTFDINKVARKTVPVTGVSAATGLVYNGQAQQGFTGTPTGEYTGSYVITYQGTLKNGTPYQMTTAAPTDAGEYTATIAIPADDACYIGSTTVTFTIEKAEIDVSGLSFTVGQYTYNGAAQGPAALAGSIPAGIAVTYTDATATNAGSYTAKAELSLATDHPENNYTIVGATTVTAQWSIGKASITVTPKNTVGYVAFDVPEFSYNVTGLYGNDTLLIPPTMTTTADMSVAGSFDIMASGADAGGNYTITYGKGTLTVLRASAGGEIAIEGWIYGEQPNKPTHQNISHDATPVYYYTGTANDGSSYSDTVAPVKAGTYSVYAVFAETAKYEEYTTATVDFVIQKATPAHTVPTDLVAQFGDTLSKITLPAGFAWQSAGTTSVGDAGEHSFLAAYTPEDTDNYNVVTDISISVTVEKLDISNVRVSISWSLTYNGMQQTRLITVSDINGQKVSYSIVGNKATDVGTYELTIIGKGNFTGSQTVRWTIDPCDISKAEVTLKDALIYNGAEQTQLIDSVVASGLQASYTLVGGNKATDVGVYYLTLQGTGNFTGTCRVKWTIAPNTEAIDGLTPDNVTSDDREAIEDVLDQIQSDEAKKEWADVIDKCEDLLDAIDKAQGSIDDLLKRIDAYHIDHVKSTDKNALERLGAEVDAFLTDGALTAEQTVKLNAAEDKLEALLGRIEEVADKMADIHDRLDDYSIDTVTSDDRADIQAIVDDIDALLDGDNLSVSERLDMENAKRRALLLLERIDEVAAAIDEIEDTLGDFDQDNVTAADRSLIEEILDDINALLNGDNLTDDERDALEADKEKAQALLSRIGDVAEQRVSLLDRLAKYDINTVKSTDKADIEDILDGIEALLDADNLTAADKTELQAGKEKAQALLERIEVAADAVKTEDITKVDGLNKDNVTRADRETLENAKADLEDALDRYPGNYTAGERADIDAKLDKIAELLALLDKLDAVQDMIDQLPETADPSDTDVKDAYDAAKDAYDELTDKEKEQIDADKLDSLGALLGTYAIIEGADGVWKDNSEDGLTFVANGAADKVSAILIDGEVIASTDYTLEAPATTLTLAAEYLATLDEGEHELTVRYADGEASCSFTVEHVGSLAWLWVVIAIVVAIGGGTLIFFLIYKKKEEKSAGTPA